MRQITVGLQERAYPIRIGAQCTAELPHHLRTALPKCDRLLVVTNSEIARLHADPLLKTLHSDSLRAEVLVIPEGETHKNPETVSLVWDHLIRHGYTRQSGLAALGGGVVGDITGFAAATYMRGIPFIQIPTTLLAMVDSSVGGKTGVNHPLAKNAIGAFWQPRLVFMDTQYLRTLPAEEFRSGYAEVLKHGLIRDADYFEFLETQHDAIFGLDDDALTHTVAVSCEIKAAVVAQDEREGGLRAILNCGHTLGHAVEALAHYSMRHGEAVAIGLVAACRLAIRMNLLAPDAETRVTRQLRRAGLPVRFPPFPTNEIVARTHSDKKVRDGCVRYILPTRIGDVAIRDDIPEALVSQVVDELKKEQ